MAPKTNCTPAKLAATLAYLQKSRVAHTLKDLEKSLPSAAQVNNAQVKDYIQALQDESKIRAEKIGSGNWYWSFVADDTIEARRALEAARAAHDKAAAFDGELKGKLAEARARRAQDGEGYEEVLDERKRLEREVEGLAAEVAAFADMDPEVLEVREREVRRWRGEVEGCTDDVCAMEGWLREAVGGAAGGEGFDALLQSIYGVEYDGEARGLRELV